MAMMLAPMSLCFVNVGPRPEWLVKNMRNGTLKTSLEQCLTSTFRNQVHDFSIGHRGACQQFPEHTAQSYQAAIEMGAGIVECDVSVTKDGELVCRHDQCDLHTSTNILAVPSLAAKCSIPFTPANPTANPPIPSANVKCCTSDLTLAEFKTLCGRMDSSNSAATSAAAYMSMDNTATFRTDLYSDAWDGTVCPTLVTHKESIAIINAAGRKFTPELKDYVQGSMSLTYDQVRQKVVDEYKTAGVSVSRVWFQSFNEPDIMYWIRNEPAFGAQAVMLDGNETFGGLRPQLTRLYAAGVRYVAPPIGQLIASSANGTGLVQSGYARDAIAAGLKVITWTVERNYECWPAEASTLATPQCKSMNELELIDTLYKMGVVGVFSDWPATTTFYASCMIAKREYAQPETASIDARPAWLVNNMAPSPLKTTLSTCLADASFVPKPHDFSIGHRGACLQFPEHTAESYTAAIEMGAGIVECDVSVTKDGELVCRHDQCDLHTSTNILAVPSLAAKCSIPFTPGYPANATHNATSARVSCCTSDLTLAEFKTLCGRMDSSKASATSAAAYMSMDNTATFRTDLYSDAWDGTVCPTLVTHKESIALINAAGRKFTPELKTYFSWSGSLTYDQVVDEYKQAKVEPSRVWLQSFNEPDIMWWIQNEPAFGAQAVMLDGSAIFGGFGHRAGYLASAGVRYIAPQLGHLIASNANGTGLVPSAYARNATAAGLKIITWTVERNYGCSPAEASTRATPPCTSFNELELIDTLYKMGVVGVFSDWPATVTFYASCIDHLRTKRPAASTCGEVKAIWNRSGCCGAQSAREVF